MADSTPPVNILKVRDDAKPFVFTLEDGGYVTPANGTVNPDWCDDSDARVHKRDLRERVEPWLTALLQSDHLNLLVGSGLTVGLSYLAEANSNSGMAGGDFPQFNNLIEPQAQVSAEAAGREQPNIEDQVRVATQLLRGLEILEDDRADGLRTELEGVLREFAQSVLDGERALATAEHDKRAEAFNALVSFLMSFASRTGSRDRLSIFTTNYDRVLEIGAELAGLHLLDRFVGSLAPIFRSSRMDLDLHYNPPGIRGEPRFVEGVARLTKLHGSLDWVNVDESIRRMGLPFGARDIAPYLDAPGLEGADANSLIIYPNSTKDRETAEYPYVELFRDLAAAVARPNSTLVTYGYSFGDEHINRVIRDALTIPSTHLVIISHDDKLGRIMDAYENWGRQAQISLMIGPELAGIEPLTSHYLPKASIDTASRRMADLLRQRIGPNPRTDENGKSTKGGA
ncbi:fibronectin-binding protein (FBP) [Leucobacter insecticola]|uniref:Fibronectin-binding protein (FBP) n=1 Tax=Leucobacter insecticola TaxID=2714934 RepID=A0A6G8FGG3_9MICO|nr:SIR2 family protein [Leucobacter insecticola]QIM15458.1 fibronectin-binding protein (FBP) [Leucobacter insecticola]